MNSSINKKLFRAKELLILNYSFLILLSSCSVSSQISKVANKTILADSATSNAFIGISIYDPATGKYLYNYNATKYFTPASNTKLFTLYAGMRYLGDSLVGIRYLEKKWDATFIMPTGDPTFLNPEFKNQPVFEFFKKNKNDLFFIKTILQFENLGSGWAWDDYNDDYMAERSVFPIYGNVFRFSHRDKYLISIPYIRPQDFTPSIMGIKFNDSLKYYFSGFDSGFLKREPYSNKINFIEIGKKFVSQEVPIHIDYSRITHWLEDTIANSTTNIYKIYSGLQESTYSYDSKTNLIKGLYDRSEIRNPVFKTIHSQPTDSLFRPMMHRSDNFFAEQTLLMVSNERLGYMSDADIIDTLLTTDLRDIPQKPKWVDGSGLSRYNLFTPQAFIYILNKLRDEFGWDRVRNILPTGGEGTLTSYFHNDRGFIYAKTGTLSNNCALSGFLLTNSGKTLIFSILANHYQTGATPIRKASERFLEEIRRKY